jgi:hypothetical protein
MTALGSSWLKALLFLGGGMGLLVGLIGFAHTEAGKPLLHWLANAAGCPVDFEGGDPARVEAFRVHALQQRDGKVVARTHPALNFELGRTTRSEVQQWVSAQGADCSTTRKGSVLSCARVSQGQQLPLEDLHFQFDAEQRLVAVDLFRPQGCGRDAVVHLRELQDQLAERVGPATQVRGTLSADYLARAYRRAAIEYRYDHYTAQISATNLGARGIRVREQYQWAPQG